MELNERVARALALADAMARAVSEGALASKLPSVKSNALGDQFWCILGARESYLRAAEAGKWVGFDCSLDAEGTRRPATLVSALDAAGAKWRAVLQAGAPGTFALDLLEHEIQHHGQLIRYFYALGLEFPKEFSDRYALS